MEVYTFTEYNKKEKDLKDYHNNMMSVVADYINLNVDFQKKYNIDTKKLNVIDLYKNQRDSYMLRFYSNKNYISTDIELDYIEYKDIITYMENPEKYKLLTLSKKFNL